VAFRVNGSESTNIRPSESVTISWQTGSGSVNSCQADSDPRISQWTGAKNPEGGSEVIPGLTQSTTFFLVCSGSTSGGSASQDISKQVFVSVTSQPPSPSSQPTADIEIKSDALKSGVDPDGPFVFNTTDGGHFKKSRITFEWTSINADTCNGQDELSLPSSKRGFSGSTSILLLGISFGPHTYTIACTGQGGQATDSIIINVTG